jgi:hypothetical protein
MSDFKWMSNGGVLLDGSGDIAMASPQESLYDMVRTRLKADLDGWKLYQIGADLERRLGDAVTPELEVTIRRQIQASLQKEFLVSGQFAVTTLDLGGGHMDVYVHVLNELVATVQVDRESGTVKVV